MDISLINLFKQYERPSIDFQQYLLRVTHGAGNFTEFATQLSWRSQLGMVLEFLDVVYGITVVCLSNGGMVIKTTQEHQHIADVQFFEPNTDIMVRYYIIIDTALKYITKPF